VELRVALKDAYDAAIRWGIQRLLGFAPGQGLPDPLRGGQYDDSQSWRFDGGVRSDRSELIEDALTILVPGTVWQKYGGWTPDSNGLFRCAELPGGAIGGCTKLLAWSPSENNDRDRLAGAEMLRAMIAAHRFGPGARLQVIAHSHGGNVALAASRLGLARGIDCLIALNKPQMDSEVYQPGENIARFYNISTAGLDWIQFLGSKVKRHYKTDRHAVNKIFDTSKSKLKPHAALVWDDGVREIWRRWVLEQQGS
jgi:hypothetical protein